MSCCESLRAFPHRGTLREDVRPGLRIAHYKKRAIIAFDVDAVSARIETMAVGLLG